MKVKRQDVLQMMLDTYDERTKEPLDDDTLVSEILLQM